uniref:Uncharacterized protein n=1 Tax=Nelumbo nucifera TaxID=4432 RepID=A0A822ZKT5_NELNU|nr:TPA_asm: hypothetical protein HUJ06_003727 [Nelumbo nucifera]
MRLQLESFSLIRELTVIFSCHRSLMQIISIMESTPLSRSKFFRKEK